MDDNKKTIALGGGCFWCTEAVFKLIKGITSVQSGYAGGHTDNPTYKEVSTGTTGHAEVVFLEYDPKVIKLNDILTVFFASHDPTQLDRQGADVGPQYRSIILYSSPDQKDEIEQLINSINKSSKDGQPIVTQVQPLDRFYPAELYHQNYYGNNENAMYCQIVINPKLEKIQSDFSNLLNSIYEQEKPKNNSKGS